MPRIAIIADIHANLPALDAVMNDLAQFEVDQVIVAGDSINVGPFNHAVLERLAARPWSVIRGNHEFYLLYYKTPREPAHWRDFPTPRYLYETLDARWRAWIGALPDELTLHFHDAPLIRVAHAAPGDHWRGIYPSTPDETISHWLRAVHEPLVISAHIHLRMDRVVHAQDGRSWRILNPGSVGLPLDGEPALASYLLLESAPEGWRPYWRRVPFDLDRLLDEFARTGYLESHGPTGRMYIEEFKTAQPRILPFKQWLAQAKGGAPETMALAEEFLSLGADAIMRYMPADLPDYALLHTNGAA